MAPRAKAKGASKQADSQSRSDTNTGSGALTTNAAPKSGRLRGRPPGNDRVTKTVKTQGQGDQATESSKRVLNSRGNGNTESSKSNHSEENDVSEQRAPKKRGRSKRAPANEETVPEAAIDGTLSTKAPPKLVEIPETQLVDPMVIDIDAKETEGPSWIGETEDGPADRIATDEVDGIPLHTRLLNLTAKYESLQARHRDLHEIGIKAAEQNYKRLRKQTDENAESSNKLISNLREELAAQSKIVEKADLLRQQLELSQTEISDLQAALTAANNALSEAKSEIKTLSTKLAASRTIEVNAKTSNNAGPKATAAGNRAFQETLQVAQAKEDLYGDLTGLIVRGIKRGEKEDVFDCIQTGRNGSLHFKLGLEKDDGNDYEDVQFTYRPQLDESRDSEVIEMLPDYLTEEITFPRAHASKFYTRVTKALTERAD